MRCPRAAHVFLRFSIAGGMLSPSVTLSFGKHLFQPGAPPGHLPRRERRGALSNVVRAGPCASIGPYGGVQKKNCPCEPVRIRVKKKCHCEPVRTLVWQSPCSSGLSDNGDCTSNRGIATSASSPHNNSVFLGNFVPSYPVKNAFRWRFSELSAPAPSRHLRP